MSTPQALRSPSEPALARSTVAALRSARSALQAAARRGGAMEIERAIDALVQVAARARFGDQTVRAVVHAALDDALPRRRGVAHRTERDAALDAFTRRASERLAASTSLRLIS